MIDLYLSSLTELKAYLLPESQQSDVRWNEMLTHIGRGVAGLFDRVTNRKLAYAAAHQDFCRGNLDVYVVERYPVVQVSALARRVSMTDDWETLTVNDYLLNINTTAGLLLFGSAVGEPETMVRITYDGGYWYSNNDYATLPAGATALPTELKFAWLSQCEVVWSKRDKLGAALIQDPNRASALAEVELLPLVKDILGSFTRHQIL